MATTETERKAMIALRDFIREIAKPAFDGGQTLDAITLHVVALVRKLDKAIAGAPEC